MRNNVSRGGALAGELSDEPVTKAKRNDNTVWVRLQAYAQLKERAATAGVSMSAFIESALLKMRTELPPTAAVAVPLASVGYRLTQIADALDHGDYDSARSDLEAARGIIAQALLPLRRDHAREARELARHDEGWSG